MNRYSVIIKGKAVADYKTYDEVEKNSRGGIIIRTRDINKYGYKPGYIEVNSESLPKEKDS